MKTKQDIFTAAWKGLAAQGFERSIDDGVCRYRGPEGRKCAIGHCIPDGAYVPAMERWAPFFDGSDMEQAIFDAVGMRRGSQAANFLTELQWAHDRAPLPMEMEASLRALAAKHGLEVPE